MSTVASHGSHVPESRFGVWFLKTETWRQHVLVRALRDLQNLMPDSPGPIRTVVDIGCGSGYSFSLLSSQFAPQNLIGVDASLEILEVARRQCAQDGLSVELHHASTHALPLGDASVDLVLCHQTFHHLVEQLATLRECRRVLRPGGLLLMSESTRRYIHSWIIRLLFRHPMDVQRSADEYLQMVRDSGFEVAESSVSYPYLWWSRPDLGVLEHWFGRTPPADREETLINLVAQRLP